MISGLEIYSYVVLIILPHLVASRCYNSDSFMTSEDDDYPRCEEEDDLMYIKAIQRNKGSEDNLKDIKTVTCCQPPRIHHNKPYTLQSADWEMSADREGWATCQSGFFLHGFYRGSGYQLNNLRWATCAKPAFHPYWYKDCYEEELDSQASTWQCHRGNYYVVGFRRGTSHSLSSIHKFKCCSMHGEILPPKSLDDVKTRIMDVTLNNLGLLAHYLGYGWCGGCRTEWSGEDFRREGDTWKSNYQEPCDGYMKKDRLQIVYENFNFKVKNMDYLSPVVKELKTIVQDVGQIKNRDSLPTKTKIVREIKTVRTLSHSSETRFGSKFGASVTLSYKSPPIAGVLVGTFSASVTLSGGNERSVINKDEEGNIQWDIARVTEAQTTDGSSGTAYQITTSRKKVDVPYKTIIQVQFTARLEGFLRSGAEFNQPHKGSRERPHFSYTIGSATQPFYKFLKLASKRGDHHWLWHDMKQKYTVAEGSIDELTDESLYEFELDGTFHDISGLNFDVLWSDISVKRNETVNA